MSVLWGNWKGGGGGGGGGGVCECGRERLHEHLMLSLAIDDPRKILGGEIPP